MRKSSFPPVIAATTRVLILGSLPGDASLAAQRYYAHPANQFWKLIGAVVGHDLVSLDYEARLDALRGAHVGLWDVIGSANRRGSLDTAIRAIDANPLAELAGRLPELAAVAFNGGTSARLGRPLLESRQGLALVNLPSSSAAYCRITLAQKQVRWNCLRTFLVDGLPNHRSGPILAGSEGV